MPIDTNVTTDLKLPKLALQEAIINACEEFQKETGLNILQYKINAIMEGNAVMDIKTIAEVEL